MVWKGTRSYQTLGYEFKIAWDHALLLVSKGDFIGMWKYRYCTDWSPEMLLLCRIL